MKAILTYHSIDDSGSVVSVGRERFRQHIDILARSGVPVVGLSELLDPDRKTGVALTFDDAFENFATEAWPLLRERRWPVTLFVATEWVGKHNAWDPSDTRVPRLPLLGWPALRTLAGEGVEIGSHTHTHPRMPVLAESRLAIEVTGSRDAIASEIGKVPSSFAYPYGDHDARSAAAVQRAGYTCAVTTDLRLFRPSEPPFALPRLDAYYLAKPGVMERWGTRGFQRDISLRGALRSMRLLLERSGRRT
jgi:peptidoglycan/xylan/chitin deacetylase (PgdA/CDA1 family)